jgi:UDP-N-acetylmuramoyl-L-alanyl-D-glutamate--2,6-diaminopimelate ligase
LFRTNGLRFAVINQDDPVAPKVLDVLAEQVRVIGFSLRSSNHLSADQLTIENVRVNRHDTTFEVFFRGQRALASLPLIGEFNIANALATIGVMLGLGVDFSDAVNVLRHLTPVAGRMDKVSDDNDRIAVYVDYAHTPDALSVALQTVRQHCTGKVRVVFGCGGNRDQGKRKQMGKVASNQADYVVLTDDNPRFESGEQIIKDIVDGCGKKSVEIIQNRSAAIQSAILSAAPGDTVLIAGKGHETTQETNGQILPHDDRQIAKAMLAIRDKTHSLDSSTTWQQKL